MALSKALGTFVLTPANSPFVITPEDGVEVGSIKVGVLSSGSIQGTKSLNGLPSAPITLAPEQVLNFAQNYGIDSVTIVITAGTIELMCI